LSVTTTVSEYELLVSKSRPARASEMLPFVAPITNKSCPAGMEYVRVCPASTSVELTGDPTVVHAAEFSATDFVRMDDATNTGASFTFTMFTVTVATAVSPPLSLTRTDSTNCGVVSKSIAAVVLS